MAELQEIAEMDYEEAVVALRDKVTELLSGLTSPELSAKADKYFQAVAKAYAEDKDDFAGALDEVHGEEDLEATNDALSAEVYDRLGITPDNEDETIIEYLGEALDCICVRPSLI